MRHVADCTEVRHAEAWVANGLHKDGAGLLVNQLLVLCGIVRLHKAHVDAQARQGDLQAKRRHSQASNGLSRDSPSGSLRRWAEP